MPKWSIFAAALAASTVLAAQVSARSAVEQHLVPVDGFRLHLAVDRGVGPVVVFESGAGLDAKEWDGVVSALAPRTKATLVAYDREGHGQSDALTTPYDIHEEVVRLHKALFSLGLDRPLVLVGHSFGGLLIQMYANVYPQDIKAMIYVDASTYIGIGGVEGARQAQDMTREALKTITLDATQTLAVKSEARQLEGYPAAAEILGRNPAPCGIPITVISQGKGDLLPVMPHWFEGHQALVSRTGAKSVRADKSGHMIPIEAPDLVANEIVVQLNHHEPSGRRAWFAPADIGCAASRPKGDG